MKIVVIGGSGLIGKKLVKICEKQGHEAIAASRSSGVNTVTGAGLDVVKGAQVVVDVANSPSFEDKEANEFFEKSGKHLLSAEKEAKVNHHIVLSVVGTDRLQKSGYFRAKMMQENLIKSSGIPYTILRATQFFEFVGAMADAASDGKIARVPPALMQPVAADDVAGALAKVVATGPLNKTIELAGPQPIGMDDFIRLYFKAIGDTRKVITDAHAKYYNLEVNDKSLMPGPDSLIGPTLFKDWLRNLSIDS